MMAFISRKKWLVSSVPVICCLASFLFPIASLAQMPAPDDVEVKVIALTDSLHVLMGIGGNIAVSTGKDGVFVVDDDVSPMSDKILAAVSGLQDEPVKMVFNTHWHFDHAGGNEALGQQGAMIVAHDNVRERMSTVQFSSFFGTKTQPSPDIALPVITFDNTASFYLNGQTIRAIHVPPAHTDGDSILVFEEANVAHLGDVFFNRMYPFIDLSSGGSVKGIIEALDRIMPLLNEETRIVPGHGPIATLDDLRDYRSMLVQVTESISALIDADKTKAEVIALQPTASFDPVWAWDFLQPDTWVGLVYDSLAKSPIQDVAVDQVKAPTSAS